ncbi:hypothetical protein LguiB_030270 [Lonicera macranthoides]
MEESQEILLNSLSNSGVTIPPEVSSIQDLTPSTLFSISAQALLRLIDHSSSLSSFPITLPDSMADRFKICTDLSSALINLGYIGDMSFHKFLYPSEEDMYKVVRFLVGRLSESSEAGKSTGRKNIPCIKKRESLSKDCMDDTANEGLNSLKEKVVARLKDVTLKAEVLNSATNPKDVFISDSSLIPQKLEEAAAGDSSKGKLTYVENGKSLMVNIEDSSNNDPPNGETVGRGYTTHISEFEHEVISPQEDSSKVRFEIEKLRSNEKLFVEEVSAKLSELQYLEEEHKLLKAAVEMALDDQHPAEFYIMKLNEQVDARRRCLVDLESHGDALRKPLEDKRRSLEEALYSTKPKACEKLQKLNQAEQETQSILSETKKREEELSRLSIDLEKQPKLAPRRSYIQRINEITKNSRKQDIDIELILKETRELQLESNSIQERLHRTYAVVDETVFREGKKDPVGPQAYRLLVSIHESFEQMSEKILATDRTRREVAEFEAKLSAMASQSLNIDKLQVDLDALRKENEFPQQVFHNSTT